MTGGRPASGDAAADVVDTWGEVAAGVAPLVVRRPLERFLDAAGLGEGAVTASPLGDGHSNVTMDVRRGDRRLVLRRPPRPPYAPSAHDVLREARILRMLEAEGARVPHVLASCDDPAVIGAPFYVMEHLAGHVLSTSLPAAFSAHDGGRAIGMELVDALVEIHAIDARRAPLSSIGRPDGYLDRQMRRFASIWEAERTREVPEVDAVRRWLESRRPESRDLRMVHGDYRLGNAMFDAGTPVELMAVLDWEMATRGDPLADLGYLCATWAEPGDPDDPMLALSAVTRLDGFPRRADLVERYAARSGRDVSGLRWYEVLARWKSAIFLEASYRRFREGLTRDRYFATLGEGVPELARAAMARAEAA